MSTISSYLPQNKQKKGATANSETTKSLVTISFLLRILRDTIAMLIIFLKL